VTKVWAKHSTGFN